MSKNIWHTGKEIPDEDQYIVVKNNMGLYTVSSEFEYDLDRVEKWAYFDDFLALETELERTRKALDVAVDALKRANNTYCAEEEDITIDLTESAAHKWQRTAYQMEMPISIALEQITALEQKDK
jgi:hypothetical protein